MAVVTLRITVALDGTASSWPPPGHLLLGEHDATITVETAALTPPGSKTFMMEGFPSHNVPWDGSISLHREDMYGDEGKLR